MPWVKGTVSGEVTKDRRIIAATRNLQVMTTSKPPDPQAAIAEGLDVGLLKHIHEERPVGPFETVAHFGGATAMLVPWGALALLPDKLMDRLYRKYGLWGEEALIMHVRNTGAPAVQNAAEPSGGMAASVDLLAEQVGEMVEMGVCLHNGWAGLILPDELKAYQERFQAQQREAWNILKPDFPHLYGANLELLSVGRDQFNGRAGILAAGPVGDFSFTVVTKLHLQGTGWRFVDLETHNGAPMRRHMVAIAPRQGRSPVVFQLNAEGALDDFGLHFVLDGENSDHCLTHIGRAVLQALGWLP